MRGLLGGLLFVSGFAAVGLEVVWLRHLGLSLGRSPEILSVLLGTYLLGLALGARLGAVWAQRSATKPVTLYGWLEVGAGISAIVVGILFQQIAPFVRSLDATSAIVRVSRALLLGSLLLVPTTFFGATLPGLSRFFDDRRHYQASWGVLYGAQTLGSAVGALFTGLVLVPRWGVSTTSRFLPMMLILVGLASIALGRTVRFDVALSVERSPTSPTSTSRWSWLVLFLSGMVIFTVETASTRALEPLLGSSFLGFTSTIAGFVLGLSIGSFAMGLLAKSGRGQDARYLLIASFATGGFSLIASRHVIDALAWWMARRAIESHVDPTTHLVVRALVAGIAIVPIAASLGVIFPTIIARISQDSSSRANRVGWGLCVNTSGSVVGSLMGTLVIIPIFGPEGTLRACGWICLATAAASWRSTRMRPYWIVIGTAIALAFTLWKPSHAESFAMRSPFVYVRSHDDLEAYEPSGDSVISRSIVWKVSDAVQNVVVGRVEDTRSGMSFQTLSLDGKIDGGESATDMVTQARLGDWPMALCFDENLSEVLVVGIGTGVTLAEIARYDVDRLDAVEISGGVIEAARSSFSRANADVFEDPRVVVHQEDARSFIARHESRWDLIVSEPSNPWVAGMGFLFTVESFEAMQRALHPDGWVAQWLQSYDLDEDLFRLVIRSFVSVFEESYLAFTDPSANDFVLLGRRRTSGDESKRPSLDRAFEAMGRRRVDPRLERYALESREQLLEGLVFGPAHLKSYAGDGDLHRDDTARLEFEAPLRMFFGNLKGIRSFTRLRTFFETLDTPWDGATDADLKNSARLAATLRLAFATGPESIVGMDGVWGDEAYRALRHLVEAFATDDSRQSSLAWRLLGLLDSFSLEGMLWVPFGENYRPQAARTSLEKAHALDVEDNEILLDLAANYEHDGSGRRYAAGASLDLAETLYREVISRTTTHERALLGLASLLARRESFEESQQLYERLVSLSPGDPVPLRGLIAVLLARGDSAQAERLISRLASLAPGDPAIERLARLAVERRDASSRDRR